MDFVTTVENIDLTCKISNDYKNDYNKYYKEVFDDLRLRYLKSEFGEKVEHMDMFYSSGKIRYPHQLIKHIDKNMAYRLYIAENVGDNYEIFISVSAIYLHLNSLNYCINEIKEKIKDIFCIEKIIDIKLSRIDICNHTTLIDDNFIKQGEENSRVVTRLNNVSTNIKLIGDYKTEINYIRYGNGDRVVRFYNKSREICEMQHKSFFIPKWLKDNLIDKMQYYVFDYVYTNIETAQFNNYMFLKYYAQLKYLDETNNTELLKLYEKFIDDPNKYSKDEMIDTMKNIITMAGYDLVKDVYNIEFQNRSSFLKSIKIYDEQGNVIDYTDLKYVNDYISELLKYLIKTFRVVSRDSEAKRKRNRYDDEVWEKLKETTINNINCSYNEKELNLFRTYQKSKVPTNPSRQILNKLIRLGFLTDITDIKNINKINIFDLIRNFEECYRPESQNYKDITEELKRLKKFYK